MKTNLLHYLFWMFFLTMGLTACDDNEDRHNKELVVTIASEQMIYTGGETHMPYWAKEVEADKWYPFDHIEDFEHEEGHEYVLRIWQEKWHDGEVIDAGIYRYRLLQILSKTEKDSEDIPSQSFFLHIASKLTGDPDVPYYARMTGASDWKPFPDIEGFTHEEGHEYVLIVSRDFKGSDAPTKFIYTYVSTHKDEVKHSVGLPE